MRTILLIDDEPRMADLVRMSLGDEVRVVDAGTLAEALEVARTERPELVLLDLALGPEDGLAILPRLRQEPALGSVPIVAFTVHDSRREEALARGVTGFVAKPFKTAYLDDIVRTHLG